MRALQEVHWEGDCEGRGGSLPEWSPGRLGEAEVLCRCVFAKLPGMFAVKRLEVKQRGEGFTHEGTLSKVGELEGML